MACSGVVAAHITLYHGGGDGIGVEGGGGGRRGDGGDEDCGGGAG